MLECLSATQGTSQVNDSQASTRREAEIARMVRFGAAPILVAALLNIFQFARPTGWVWSWALACACFNCLLGASSLALSFVERVIRQWRPFTFLTLTGLVVSDTVLGTLGHQPKLLFISLILLMVGTGSLLPWPIRLQTCFDLVCLTAWAARLFQIPALDGAEVYNLFALTTAAGLSYFTSWMRERFVREYEESARTIQESETALRQMFDANTDGIALVDAATRRVQDVNQHFLRMSGFLREEVIGKTSDELNVWTDAMVAEEVRRRLQVEGNVSNVEVTFRFKSGREVPCLLSLVHVVINGRQSVMMVARDVSDLRRSQDKLRESEEKFRLIFESSRDAIVLTRAADGSILEVNEHFIRLLGFTRDDAVGRTFLALGLWALPEQRATFIEALINPGYLDDYEVSMRKRDGKIIPVLTSAVTVKLAGEDCYLGIVRDISALKEAEQKIRESEASLRRIFDAGIDGMTISEIATGNYLDVNAAFLQISGYAREEVIGSNFFKLGLWPDQKEWTQFVDTLVFTGEVRNQPCTFRRRDGTLSPCLISAIKCEVWGKVCCIATTRDITILVEAQEKLRRSEKTFRKIFDTSLDAISIVDANTGEYIDVNPEFVRETGFSREEIIGKTADALRLWANPEHEEQFRRVLTEKNEVRNLQADFRLKDGSILPCLTSGVLAYLGGRLCCLGVTRDISELRASHQKLRKSETMLRAMFDNSLDSVVLIDLSTETLVEVNAECSRVLGYTREEMIGRRFDELMPPVESARRQQLMAIASQGREVRNFEITLATRDGRTFPALVSVGLFTIDGRPYALGVARDITDLVAAREAALASSQAKSEFLSIMSHEIRTPMNAILGMADLMGESELNLDQRRYLDTILSNGNALLELINSILDLAKVESGRLSLELIEFDLAEVVERAADTLAVRAHEKGIELAVRLEPDLPAIVTGDPYRLRQILTNLIGNGIKFTTQGEVVVSVRRNPDSPEGESYLFAVRDTGIGIAPEKIDTIFSIFTQADTSITRKFGGSGLGLAIVQRLVALMGGRVWLESEVGKGSTFFFTVELKGSPATPQVRLPMIDARLRDVLILVVEENATSRGIFADLIRAKGWAVAAAASEAEAIAALEAARRENAPFALMVADCEMQTGDGFEALARIRGAGPHLPVIVLVNSNGLTRALPEMERQGIHHYCIKPVKRRDLYDAIAEVMTKAAPRQVLLRAPHETISDATPKKTCDRPLRILLADDSVDNRLLIRAYIRKTPYILTEVENGQSAVERFIDGSYDLVLMDIQMPVLDGYSAVRTIRKWELDSGRPRTPIIALTASALEEDVRRAREAGCEMHISKPVKKVTLLDAVVRATEAATLAPAMAKPEASSIQPVADFQT